MPESRSSSTVSLLIRTALGTVVTLALVAGVTLLLTGSWDLVLASVPVYLWVAVLGGVLFAVLDEIRRRRRAAPPAARP